MKKQIRFPLHLLLILILVLNGLGQVASVYAITTVSTEPMTTASTEESKQAVNPLKESNKSMLPSTTVNLSETVPEVSPKNETTHEDNYLQETVKEDSPTPAVVFETKKLTQEVHLKGEIKAGRTEENGLLISTELTQLILQKKKADGDWADYHSFEIKENQEISVKGFAFEFSEVLIEDDLSSYRLVADYDVIEVEEETEQNRTAYKGNFLIGTVEAPEKTIQDSSRSEAGIEDSSEISIESSVEQTEISEEISQEQIFEETDISQDSIIQESKTNESVTIPEPDPSFSLFSRTLELPMMDSNVEDQNQLSNVRSLGMIMPMAVNNPGVTIVGNNKDNYQSADRHLFRAVSIVRSKYVSLTAVDVTFRVAYAHQAELTEERAFSVETNDNASKPLQGNKNRWLTKYSGDYGVKELPKNYESNVIPQELTGFKNTFTKNLVNEGSTGYYNKYHLNDLEFTIRGLPFNNSNIMVTFDEKLTGGQPNQRVPISWVAYLSTIPPPNIKELKPISKPEFESIDEKDTAVYMKRGTYTGDVLDDVGGTLDLATISGFGVHLNTIGHTNTRNGTYYVSKSSAEKEAIGGLSPGTEYTARIKLQDVFGNWQPSESNVFRTPNTVNKPGAPTLNIPTASNNATAKFTTSYVVGAVPAHPINNPENVRVEISPNGTNNWKKATISDVSLIRENNTGKVNYTITGLAPNTVYYSRVAVNNKNTNKGGAWSPWAYPNSFKTRSLALSINKPTFKSTDGNTTTVNMSRGTYTGDISKNGTDGILQLSTDNGTNFWNHLTNIGHTTSTDGTYYISNPSLESEPVRNLSPGTDYLGRIRLYDADGTSVDHLQRSEPQRFYTPNDVIKPTLHDRDVPTTVNNATATFKGTYVVNNASPAHPRSVKARWSIDNGSSWKNASISGVMIDTAMDKKEVNFTVTGLKAETKYLVQYAVLNNDDDAWSPWSDSLEFTTLGLPDGLYILDFPTLDFGKLKKESFGQTASLSNDSVKNHVVIDNTDINVGWSLSAKLEPLKRSTDAQVMPWATLRMDINLQNTTDNGGTWNDYTTGVTGVPRTLTLNAGDPAQNLWSISNSADARGTFRNEIDWTSVELDVPANQEGYYKGKLVWSLDSIP